MVGRVLNIRHRRTTRRHVRHSKLELAFIAAHNTRLQAGATFATGSILLGANPGNGKIVTIGSKVYTFETSLTNVDGHVKIGADATASAVNLFHAINNSGGTSGTDYAALTTAHADVTATNPSVGRVTVTAKVAGTAANAKVTTTDVVSGAWGAATLTGGAGAPSGVDTANLLLRNKAETIAAATNTSTLS